MIDTYKGESEEKKVARLHYWECVQKALGPAFYKTKHIVLASREGGDISVLSGLGVEPGNVIAVDRNRDAAAVCKQRWPSADVRVGDVAAVAERESGTQSVFLDFCGQMCGGYLDLARRCLLSAGRPSVIGIATMRGRESDVGQMPTGSRLRVTDAADNRAARRREAKLERGFKFKQGLLPLKELLALVSATSHNAGHGGIVDRASAMYMLFKHVRPSNAQIGQLMHLAYQSRTNESNGVPMMISAMYVQTRSDFRLKWDSHVSKINLAETSARDMVADVPDRPWDMLLNIPMGTIAAWKAHATRGTYERSA